MDSEVQPRRSLESQRDEKFRTAEDATPPCNLRLKAPHEGQVPEVAEEELALQVEYVGAQLRTLRSRNQQRAVSLDISTFRPFIDSISFVQRGRMRFSVGWIWP